MPSPAPVAEEDCSVVSAPLAWGKKVHNISIYWEEAFSATVQEATGPCYRVRALSVVQAPVLGVV